VRRHEITVEVRGPWSLATSKAFWEGFSPSALPMDDGGPDRLRSVFRVDRDWSRAEVEVTQRDAAAHVVVTGDGDLDAAAAQACHFLSLDIDARGWPDVGRRDPVIADAQARLRGLRPCGFHSPYEAAAWSVLSQRVRIVLAPPSRHPSALVGFTTCGRRSSSCSAPPVISHGGWCCPPSPPWRRAA
jgi:DNA-3-methyladenine glycosylase II